MADIKQRNSVYLINQTILLISGASSKSNERHDCISTPNTSLEISQSIPLLSFHFLSKCTQDTLFTKEGIFSVLIISRCNALMFSLSNFGQYLLRSKKCVIYPTRNGDRIKIQRVFTVSILASDRRTIDNHVT